jgi:hypothetical protein
MKRAVVLRSPRLHTHARPTIATARGVPRQIAPRPSAQVTDVRTRHFITSNRCLQTAATCNAQGRFCVIKAPCWPIVWGNDERAK